jgi:hypothetical protein
MTTDTHPGKGSCDHRSGNLVVVEASVDALSNLSDRSGHHEISAVEYGTDSDLPNMTVLGGQCDRLDACGAEIVSDVAPWRATDHHDPDGVSGKASVSGIGLLNMIFHGVHRDVFVEENVTDIYPSRATDRACCACAYASFLAPFLLLVFPHALHSVVLPLTASFAFPSSAS